MDALHARIMSQRYGGEDAPMRVRCVAVAGFWVLGRFKFSSWWVAGPQRVDMWAWQHRQLAPNSVQGIISSVSGASGGLRAPPPGWPDAKKAA